MHIRPSAIRRHASISATRRSRSREYRRNERDGPKRRKKRMIHCARTFPPKLPPCARVGGEITGGREKSRCCSAASASGTGETRTVSSGITHKGRAVARGRTQSFQTRGREWERLTQPARARARGDAGVRRTTKGGGEGRTRQDERRDGLIAPGNQNTKDKASEKQAEETRSLPSTLSARVHNARYELNIRCARSDRRRRLRRMPWHRVRE